MIKFLQERSFMQERLELGIDVHPSDDELKEFQKLAKKIDPDRYFTIYGCQKCVNELVKFVFDAQKENVKKVTFPLQTPGDDKPE